MTLKFMPLNKLRLGTYDPVSHQTWRRFITYGRTRYWTDVWQHIKYGVFGAKVEKVWFVMEEVICGCTDGYHRRCVLKCVSKPYAEEVANNFAMTYKAMWAMRAEHDFLDDMLPQAARMNGKHTVAAAPEFTVMEFANVKEAAKYLTKLTEDRRKLWRESRGGFPLPMGGIEGLDGDTDESFSMQDIGGAYMVRHKTTTRRTERPAGWGAKLAQAQSAAKKDDTPN